MKNLKDRVTIYQVAQAAGVSLATVSRVINKSGSVTESTRRKVEETIASLGYKPSALAQALATNRSTNVGVIIPSANYVYISNFLNGLTGVGREKGYIALLSADAFLHYSTPGAFVKALSAKKACHLVFKTISI